MRTPLTPHSSESEGFAQSLRSFAGSLSARCGGPCKNPSLSVGFAALRAPHPFPLAAWALANYLKLTALRPLGFSRTSPYRSKLLTALHEKSPALCAELQIVCGEGGSEELPECLIVLFRHLYGTSRPCFAASGGLCGLSRFS